MYNLRDIAKMHGDEIYVALDSGSLGLSGEDVALRQKKYGPNRISEKKKTPAIIEFMLNFTSLMAILLWIGGAVAFFFTDMAELGIAIWLVNIINGLFSFIQEYRAEKATEALKKILPKSARVIRDGKEEKIPVEDLVPGDVILVEEGDSISADARLVETTELMADQSTLTGESVPVGKDPDAVDKEVSQDYELDNMIFTGTSVTKGDGKAVVIHTGMKTAFGRIAHLSQNMKEEKSPLQKELDKLTKQISLIAIAVGIVFIIAAVFFVKEPLGKSFIFALGMMVAFIPEGLLPTVTLALAMSVQRMAKKHALVKKLSSVETLGSTTVICSDKTGTLTKNEMTVRNIRLINKEYKVTGTGYSSDGDILLDDKPIDPGHEEDMKMLLTAAALCSNARVVENENGKFTVLGDPTEACLGVAAGKAGIKTEAIAEEYKRIKELPFDSERKRMSTINEKALTGGSTKRIAFIKGAPQELAELSVKIRENGEDRVLTDKDRENIINYNDDYARQGLRVLAVGIKEIDDAADTGGLEALGKYTPETIEKDIVLLGLIIMHDPPHPEIFEAVKKCSEADIRIIMITGDYGLTAKSIAMNIGIVKSKEPRIVTGRDLSAMSDDELKTVLRDEVIFARTAPEQKYRIVDILKGMDNVVAVTGDGVNDAPALKKADIGIAMGITGTDVAKESADMILTDDNFASIIDAIEEGRTVYSNIQKFLLYILNSNLPEAVPSAVFLLSRGMIPLPLTVMQILSIDLGTDMIPALGLGTERPEEGIMQRPPRSRSKPLLNKKVLIKAFAWYGMLEGIIAMGAFFWANYMNGWPDMALPDSGIYYREATTMVLASIIFCQIGAVMNCRTETESVFKLGIFKNRLINMGILLEIGLLCALMYIPQLNDIFNTAPIGIYDWIFLLCCPFFVIAVEEIRKACTRKISVSDSIR